MSYKIVRQTLTGQRRQTVSNGWMNYEDACTRAHELEEEMIENNDCEMRGGSAMEKFEVVEE